MSMCQDAGPSLEGEGLGDFSLLEFVGSKQKTEAEIEIEIDNLLMWAPTGPRPWNQNSNEGSMMFHI